MIPEARSELFLIRNVLQGSFEENGQGETQLGRAQT